MRKDLLIIFLLIVIAPFCVFIHFAPLGDFWDFFIASFSVVACAVVVLGRTGFKDKTLITSPLIGFLCLFFIVLCLLTTLQQTLLSQKITLIVYAAVVLLASLLALRLAAQNTVQYYDYLAFVLFIGGLIESFGAIAIQYRLAGIDYWMVPMSDRFIGFVAQSNQLAIYIMVSFLALCYLTLRRIVHLVVLVLFSLLFGFVLLGSGSRAVLLYLIAIALITIFTGYKNKDKDYLQFVIALAALIVGALIYYFLPSIVGLFSVDQTLLADTSGALSRSASSESFRLSEITKAFAMLKDAPLIGVGFGNYAVNSFWLAVNNPDYYTVSGDLTLHSHNIVAQIMAEFGLVGLFSLLAILGYIGYCFWKKPKTLQWWFGLSVFTVYFINSSLEYVMWRMHFVPLLFLVIIPVLSTNFKVVYPKVLNILVSAVLASVLVLVVGNSLTTYAKSFFYSADIVGLDQGDYQVFRSATHDLLWGDDIKMQEFSALSPVITDLPYQQKITEEALNWRPFAPVLIGKIQLLLLTGQIGHVDKYAKALAVYYPSVVPTACGYFKNFNTLENLQGLRVVEKELNCRVLKSSK